MKIFSYIKSIPSLIILLQHLFQIRSLIEDFPSNLRVGDNLSVAIVLQGTGTDIQPLAHILTCEVEFSGKEWPVRPCHFYNSFPPHLLAPRQPAASRRFPCSNLLPFPLYTVVFRFVCSCKEQLFHILTFVIALVPDLRKR